MKLIDLTGKQFHKLTVLSKALSGRAGKTEWLCKCECGNEKVISACHLTRTSNPVKSCGCSRFKRGNQHAQWLGFEGISGDWWYNHVLRERKNTRSTQVPVTITKEFAWNLYLEQDKKCALSGVDILVAGGHEYNTASIDRIDSSKGYEEGNIQWVHKHVNFMKRTYSQDYFIDMCKKIAYHNKDS